MWRCESRVNIVSWPKCARYVPLRGTCRRFAALSQYCFMSQKPECRLPTEVSTLCAAARNVSSLGNVVSDSIDWGERSSQPILKMDEPVCLKFSRRNFKILRATLEQETAENHFLDKGRDFFIVVPTTVECSNSISYHCLGTEFLTSSSDSQSVRQHAIYSKTSLPQYPSYIRVSKIFSS